MSAPAFSTGEWEAAGTDEPDTRHTEGMASESPARAGYVMVPVAIPAARTSSAPHAQEPPWVDPPFDAYFPTIMGNLTVLDSGDGNNLYGVITCRQLNAGIVSGIQPSGDHTGATDTATINGALAGGAVLLAPGDYYVTNLTVPSTLGLAGSGSGTVLHAAGTGATISMHGTTVPPGGFGTLTDKMFGGYLRDFLVDGTGHPAGVSYGLDFGDPTWHSDVRHVQILHFNQPGDIGFRGINNIAWTEKCTVDVTAFDCDTAATLDMASGAQPSWEYNDLRFCILCKPGQNGLIIRNGAYLNNGSLTMRGNFNTASTAFTTAALTITGSGGGQNSHITGSLVDIALEVNNSHTYGPQTINFGASSNSMQRNTGVLSFSDSPWAQSNASGGNFANFSGTVHGDATLVAAAGPAAPVHYQPPNPPTSASTVMTMAGFGTVPTTFTPQSSGNVVVTMSGAAYTATSAVPLSVGAFYGSGTAPSNGAAQVGNRFGTQSNYNLTAPGIAGTANTFWSFTDTLSLSLQTQYWFDAGYLTSDATAAVDLRNVGITISELPLYQ